MKRFCVLSLSCLFALLTACGPAAQEQDDGILFTIPSFTLTNQDNQPFGSEQLKGKTWIATLFFTECAGPCPMMTGRLRDIQAAMADPNVVIVSVSCDPAKDTPAVLKNYATNVATAKDGKWFFLTGEPDRVKDFAIKGLKLHYEPAGTNQPIEHSTKFLLIDSNSHVRGIYDTDDDASMQRLKVDAVKLAQAK